MIIFSEDARDDIVRLRSFLDQINPGAARRAMVVLFTTIESLQDHPNRGHRTDDPDIRQLVVRFGTSGYVVRYVLLPATSDILITRIWHGREARH
ncbi:type II toxin-antitoxin system RelE/ParE family toxin [Bradyrhizobium sp. HKCCYLS1011]|uniref:type II toxin-antitoxin system RelE/ParE family toxin n=1 Tax=Bradyrhizobium sp. HKCCYLS1011 TaxID=3420733 RepID=UPI003EB7E9BC